jgi:hypothetical protein
MDRTTVTILVVAGGAFVAWTLYKRAAAAKVTQASDISNPAARGVRSVTNTSSRYFDKAGVLGRTADEMINGPAENVLRGDVGGTVKSVLTGGITDVVRAWW